MELSNGGHQTYDREVGIQGNYMQFGHIQMSYRWFHGPDSIITRVIGKFKQRPSAFDVELSMMEGRPPQHLIGGKPARER